MTNRTTVCGECDETIRVYRDIDGKYVDCGNCGNFGYIA